MVLIFDVPEKSRLPPRIAAFALARQHEAHIVAEAFDRRALIGGNRTIIAQHWRSAASYSFAVYDLGRLSALARFADIEAGQPSSADLYVPEPPKYSPLFSCLQITFQFVYHGFLYDMPQSFGAPLIYNKV